MHTVSIPRPQPLVFHLDRLERWFLLQPPSRETVRGVIALDREENLDTPEGLLATDDRVARQLKMLASEAVEVRVELDPDGKIVDTVPVEPAVKFPVGELAPDEERELLVAIMCWHSGIDPAAGVAAQQALKKKAIMETLLALAQSDSPSSTATPLGSPDSSSATSEAPNACPTENP